MEELQEFWTKDYEDDALCYAKHAKKIIADRDKRVAELTKERDEARARLANYEEARERWESRGLTFKKLDEVIEAVEITPPTFEGMPPPAMDPGAGVPPSNESGEGDE